MLEIGKRIKALRQKKGWSQVDAAESLGISVPAFSKIETDVTDVSISRLVQITDVFNVHISHMFVEEDLESIDELKKAKVTIEAQAAKISHLQEYIITLYEELIKAKALVNH